MQGSKEIKAKVEEVFVLLILHYQSDQLLVLCNYMTLFSMLQMDIPRSTF